MSTTSKNRVIKTPRAMLRDSDTLSVTRPTIARTGDQEHMGLEAQPFDDRATIAFVTASANIQYPFGLPVGDVNLSGSIQVVSASTPGSFDDGGGIVTIGSVHASVVDPYIRSVPGSVLGYDTLGSSLPFVEQQLHAVESASLDDPFYITGSKVSDVGIGFTQPLWSKTKIEIDLTPTTAKTFGYIHTASDVLQQPTYTPMVYYNFDERAWNVIGRPLTASGFQVGNADVQKWLEEGTVGFTRGMELLATGVNLACRPCSNFGFPSHPKFHAEPGQAFHMSGVINQPFLLEKFVYEVDIAYTIGAGVPNNDRLIVDGPLGALTTDAAASILTFFMLNQRAPFSSSVSYVTQQDLNGAVSDFTITSSLPAHLSISGSDIPQAIDTTRDLITFGQIVSYSGSHGSLSNTNQTIDQFLIDGLGRELNLDIGAEKGTGTADTGFTRRRLVMSGTAKSVLKLDSEFGWRTRVMPTASTLERRALSGSNSPGGRTNIPMGMTGRDLVASQPGGIPGKKLVLDTGTGKFYEPNVPIINSPYLLMPSDRLVFGWQIPHLFDNALTSGSQPIPAHGTGPQITLHPGIGKLTLYGSLITDGHEFHDTLNQPLVTDAINEVLYSGNPATDQFDTEPFEMLSGSHVAAIITGSLRNGEPRSVIADAANPGQPEFPLGTTYNDRQVHVYELRGRSRNIACVDQSELFFDCLLPRAESIAATNSATIAQTTLPDGNQLPGVILLDVEERFGPSNELLNADPTWSMSFPYEPRYSTSARDIDPFSSLQMSKRWTIGTGIADGAPRVANSVAIARSMIDSTGQHAMVVIADKTPNSSVISNLKDSDARKHYYGIGDLNTFVSSSNLSGSHNIPEPRDLTTDNGSNGFGVTIRGWKYGIKNGIHEYSRAIFRRDHFGHMRDMLEQRTDAKYFSMVVPGTPSEDREGSSELSSPITVAFFDTMGNSVSPYSEFISSSNRSLFATSSLPYFDGIARN